MKIVPIDNIIDRPMLKVYKGGGIIVNLPLAILARPEIYDGIPVDIITLHNMPIDYSVANVKPEWQQLYLHLYIVEADAYRIAMSIDDDPADGIRMILYDDGHIINPSFNMPAMGYYVESVSLVRWLTQTFEYKFDTHPWYYHRVDWIDTDSYEGKRIVRMV